MGFPSVVRTGRDRREDRPDQRFRVAEISLHVFNFEPVEILSGYPRLDEHPNAEPVFEQNPNEIRANEPCGARNQHVARLMRNRIAHGLHAMTDCTLRETALIDISPLRP